MGEYVPTVFENHVTYVQLPEAKVELALWDTAGQEDYAHIRPLSYDAAHVFLICCSVDNKDSFDNIKEKWVPEIAETNPKCPFFYCWVQGRHAGGWWCDVYLGGSKRAGIIARRTGVPGVQCTGQCRCRRGLP